MKGAILSIDPRAQLVDISHGIRPGNVREGAFVLYCSIPFFPPAIHVAVVDPGVGTDRRGIVISCRNGTFVGPDNGLMIPAARRVGMETVREIANPKMWRPDISGTFHGRDVFGPVAAHLSSGVDVGNVGPVIEDWADLDFGWYTASEDVFKGEIIFVDHFGNLITNIPGSVFSHRATIGQKADVRIRNKLVRIEFLKSYGFGREGQPLLAISSSGFVELAVGMGNAQERFKAREGASISIRLLRARKHISR